MAQLFCHNYVELAGTVAGAGAGAGTKAGHNAILQEATNQSLISVIKFKWSIRDTKSIAWIFCV